MSIWGKQIGGTHYRKMKIQPSQFVIENKMLFAEGNIIKYICRHPYKDGKQDLEKAKHFIDMIIERDYSGEEEPTETWVRRLSTSGKQLKNNVTDASLQTSD